VADPGRIKTLRLTNFLPFAGEVVIPFEGKNLLVYGENGCGKSALFRALKGFFAITPPKEDFRNVFVPDQPWSVVVEFVDGAEARWDARAHPAQAGRDYSERVGRAARRSACLGYGDLVEVTEANVFNVAVQRLLADFGIPSSGGRQSSLRELMRLADSRVPKRETTAALGEVGLACREFNRGMRIALDQLEPIVPDLLNHLDANGMEVKSFRFPGVAYKTGTRKERMVGGRILEPTVSFHGHSVEGLRKFFNEARLSALALALFLAGRLACVPAEPEPETPRILVLDDVLIGLDMGHRLPLLELLRNRFSSWQIVLMTHDLVWFDLARDHGDHDAWSCLGLYPPPGLPPAAPIVSARGDLAREKATLAQARVFVAQNHLPAAGNYARVAFELALKRLCEESGSPVPFRRQARDVRADLLASSLKAKAAAGGNLELGAALGRALMFRRIVLNPASHPDPPGLGRSEVEGAIAAVAHVCSLTARDRRADSTRALLQEARRILADHPDAAACARARTLIYDELYTELKAFARSQGVLVPFGREPSLAKLWALTEKRFPNINLAEPVRAHKRQLFGAGPFAADELLALVDALAPGVEIRLSH